MPNISPEVELERRRKISESNKKRWANKDYKERVRKAIRRGWTEESKSKASKKRKELWSDEEYRTRVSETHKDKWASDGYKERLKGTHKKRWTSDKKLEYSNRMKQLLQEPERREKHMAAIVRTNRFLPKNPTKLELKYQKLLNDLYPGQWYFNGGGINKVVIGTKFPDFIHTDQLKIIEVYGHYWHKDGEEIIREQYFKQYGYQTLVIWDTEDDAQAVFRIQEFMNS